MVARAAAAVLDVREVALCLKRIEPHPEPAPGSGSIAALKFELDIMLDAVA